MELKTRTNQPVEGDEIVNLKVTGQAKLFENIVDADGHNRFVEGNGNFTALSGEFEITYNKWSLSGTHLMLVLAGTVKAGTSIGRANNQTSFYALPAYILSKIKPLVGNNYIEYKAFTAYVNESNVMTGKTLLGKSSNGVYIRFTGGGNVDVDRTFRIQYDLLIDDE